MKVVKSPSKEKNVLPIKVKVALENMPYPTYRKLLLPPNINMMQLHFVLQYAMGWHFSHLFQFSDKKGRPTLIASIPVEDDDFYFSSEERKANLVKLNKDFYLQREAKPFWYWYDFGDDWWHKITFQKPTKKDLEAYEGFPLCTEGAGVCPPEDVGGVWGYEEFLEAIENKKHPEHADYREWMCLEPGEKYELEFTDFPGTNKVLKSLPSSPDWKTTSDNYFSGF